MAGKDHQRRKAKGKDHQRHKGKDKAKAAGQPKRAQEKAAKGRATADPLRCPGCKRRCPLTKPRCGKGRRLAEKLGVRP